MEVLRGREEFTAVVDDDGGEVLSPDIAALFFGRNALQRRSTSIGPDDDDNRLEIEVSRFDEIPFTVDSPVNAPLTDFRPAMLKVRLQENEWSFTSGVLSQLLSRDARLRRTPLPLGDQSAKWPTDIECESLGPGLPSDVDVVRYWDRIALTDRESQPLRGLQLILGRSVDRIAVVGDDSLRGGRPGRRVILRLPGEPHPVPLKSLGDGAVRLFGVRLGPRKTAGTASCSSTKRRTGFTTPYSATSGTWSLRSAHRGQRAGPRDYSQLGLRQGLRTCSRGERGCRRCFSSDSNGTTEAFERSSTPNLSSKSAADQRIEVR